MPRDPHADHHAEPGGIPRPARSQASHTKTVPVQAYCAFGTEINPKSYTQNLLSVFTVVLAEVALQEWYMALTR